MNELPTTQVCIDCMRGHGRQNKVAGQCKSCGYNVCDPHRKAGHEHCIAALPPRNDRGDSRRGVRDLHHKRRAA